MSQHKFAIRETNIDGLFSVDYKLFADQRGSVMEFYRESDFVTTGLPSLGSRPQVNAPQTLRGGLRGIHAEFAHKLVAVASGEVYAVIVDLRKSSSTSGQWLGFNLQRGQGLFIERGLGNSFQSVSIEPSTYLYFFEQEWHSDMPGTACNPLDPTLNIQWPIPENSGMILSDKDRSNPNLKQALV